ncbi:hypothetical protein MUP01_09150 [Candidatus Bathyarchaeota archaeon]|nr:hypothetical protein [Candidatus Bathyarchaeota archaeon]
MAKSTIFIAILNYVGIPTYSVLLILLLSLALMHVTLRRLKKIEGEILLGITGFIFPMIIYMLGSLIVALMSL